MTQQNSVFSSFWMAGFESSCHVNGNGIRLDMIHATQHERFVDVDYANLRRMGIRSVRDTVRWHLVEPTTGVFDFSSMDPIGGEPCCLDVVGVNFYHDNQWEHPGGRKIAWHIHPRDVRWMPLHKLLQEVYERYRRPTFVGETSHVGSGRAEWLREVTDEIARCWYGRQCVNRKRYSKTSREFVWKMCGPYLWTRIPASS